MSETYTARLAADDWASNVDIDWDPQSGEGILRGVSDLRFYPPVRLAFTESQLLDHLRVTAEAAKATFPEVEDDLERAYRNFTIQLDAYIRSEANPGSAITLRGELIEVSGGEVTGPKMGEAPSAGVYFWSADRPPA